MVDSTKTLSYRDIVDSTNQASHTNHVMADSTEIFSVLWLIATAMHCILTAYGMVCFSQFFALLLDTVTYKSYVGNSPVWGSFKLVMLC